VAGAISRQADKAVQDDAGNLDEASLGEVFDALSEVDESGGAVRRRAWVDDFSPAAQGQVQRLIKARLLTSDREPKTGRAWVEVVHEAVLREWPRFSTWLKDYGAFKLWRKGLNEARAHWLKQGRDSAELLLGARLKEALIKRNERPLLLTRDENEFIHRSRVQRWVTGLKLGLVFTVLPVLVGGYLLWKDYEDLTHRAVYYLALAQLGQWHSLQPDMVTIPPDRECSPGRPCTFQMGSPPDQCAERKEECPQHEVTFRKPFKLGKYEVTFDEYEVFLRWIGQDGGCKDGHPLGKRYRQDFGFGRGGRPVINVSWEDAQCYAEWLSGKTGNRYRLPTEAEWEYAARAGSSEDYFWGESADQAGDYAWFSDNSDSMTQPVGRKRPNGFGLYDTAGNVWEWVEDCYHENYDQAPSDGHQAWGQENGDDCDVRVIRGGSRFNAPVALRSAARDGIFPVGRDGKLGFRLAQDP
jgi:formylglycine-generating enzyme required for sulfatase activity